MSPSMSPFHVVHVAHVMSTPLTHLAIQATSSARPTMRSPMGCPPPATMKSTNSMVSVSASCCGAGIAETKIVSVRSFPPDSRRRELLSATKSTRMMARFVNLDEKSKSHNSVFQKGEHVRAIFKKECESKGCSKLESNTQYFPMQDCGKLKANERVLHDVCMRRLAASKYLSHVFVRYAGHWPMLHVVHVAHASCHPCLMSHVAHASCRQVCWSLVYAKQ